MATGNTWMNSFIWRTLYSLKRQYGGPVDVYKLLSAGTDYKTGVKTSSKSVVSIRRCIVLPVKIQREAIRSIAHLSANKMFSMGGTFDAGVRIFVIDRRDVPKDFEIAQDDWLVYDARRYEIKDLQELEQRTAWIITGKEVKGCRPEQVISKQVESFMDLSHGEGDD